MNVMRRIVWSSALSVIISITLGLMALTYVRHADDERRRAQEQAAARQRAQTCVIVRELEDTYRELPANDNTRRLADTWASLATVVGCPPR